MENKTQKERLEQERKERIMKRIKAYMPEEEDSTPYSKEYKSKLLPQIRKEERKK